METKQTITLTPALRQDAFRQSLPLSVDVHNEGHIALEDFMGSDLSIVNAAKVSFDTSADSMGEHERGLINYLMANHHGTPFEHVTLKFDVKAPLFVFREWHRHRAGWSYNENSARYSEMSEEFYIPMRDDIRHQVGKPGNYSFDRMESDEEALLVQDMLVASQSSSFSTYKRLLDKGVAKEVARISLPVGMYSRMKATCNLRSLMHFCELRNSEFAQKEIRSYAVVMEELARMVCPVAMAAFDANGRRCP